MVTGHLPECERVRDGTATGLKADGTGWLFAASWANRSVCCSKGCRWTGFAGTTVLTGRVIDQVHLHVLIQRTQELGLELISIEPADEGSDETGRSAS